MEQELFDVLLRLDSRLDSIESRMTGFESRLTAGFESVDSRSGTLESRMSAGFESVDLRLTSVESRTASLEANVTALRDDMLSHFDGIYKQFGRLESGYQALTAAVKRIEEQHHSEN